MKGWRERAADIFAKHGEIAAKMKSAPGPGPSDSQRGRDILSLCCCLSYTCLMLRSRQAEGESPVSAANARERYSSVEKPERVATSFTGSGV